MIHHMPATISPWDAYSIEHTSLEHKHLIGQFYTCAHAIASIPEARHGLYPPEEAPHTDAQVRPKIHLIRNDIPPYLRGPHHNITIGRGYYETDMRNINHAIDHNILPYLYLRSQHVHADPTLVTCTWHHPLPDILHLYVSIRQEYRIHADEHMVRLDACDDMVCDIKPAINRFRAVYYTTSRDTKILVNTTTTTLIDTIQQRILRYSSLSGHEKISLIRDLPTLIVPNIRDVIRPFYIVE